MEIVKHEISKEANVTVEITEGNIVLKAALDTSGLGAQLITTVNGDYFFDKLKEAIPGQIDDAVIDMLKAAVKAIS
jgi:hypothetical protein